MNKEAYALIEENAATLKTRFDAVSYLLGYYGEIDAEIYEAIQAAYISDIICLLYTSLYYKECCFKTVYH